MKNTMWFRVAMLALWVAALWVSAAGQEKLTLSTPIAQPTVADYTVDGLSLWPRRGAVTVLLVSNAGHTLSCEWNDNGLSCDNGFRNEAAAKGVALIRALNTANLSVTSLEKRIYVQLVSDGVLVGTVTGAPK